MGGVLALNYAIDNPLKVKSLVLIGAQCEMPKTLLKLQSIVFRLLPEKSFKGMGLGKEEFIKLTNSMMNLDFREKLKNISCDTLVICGEKDKVNTDAPRERGKGPYQKAMLAILSGIVTLIVSFLMSKLLMNV